MLPVHICDQCLDFLKTIKEKLDIYSENDKNLRKLLEEKQTMEEIKDDPDPSETFDNVEAIIEHVEVKQEEFELNEEIAKSPETQNLPKRSTRRKIVKNNEEPQSEPKCKNARISEDEDDCRQSDLPSSQSESEVEQAKVKTRRNVKRRPRKKRDNDSPKKRRIRRQYPDGKFIDNFSIKTIIYNIFINSSIT